MKLVVLTSGQGNQKALCHKLAAAFEVVGVVHSDNVPRKPPRHRLRLLANRVAGRTVGAPLAWAWSSHCRTRGMFAVQTGSATACIAPQRVWPHRTRCRTPSPRIAYSMVAASPLAAPGMNGGTMLPAFRSTNRSPGRVWQIRSGTMRESG